MAAWRFFEYVSAGGENPFRNWYLKQDEEVRAALDLTVYERTATHDWLTPPSRHAKKQFKVLDQEHAGLAELRFWTDGGRRRFRVAGIYDPWGRRFVLLDGCEKEMGGEIYLPSDAFDKALKHKAALESGKGHLVDHT